MVSGKPKADRAATEEIPRRRIWSPVGEDCSEGACGLVAEDLDEADPLLAGWVRVEVLGSSDPPRLYCSGRCATRGVSLAMLRVGGGVRR